MRFLTTRDDISIAWADVGSGKPLVKAANWLTHLEFDWEGPVWCHWTRFFADNFRSIRYDERGCGLSDWKVGDLTFPRWVEDLESVVTAAEVDEPFVLLGISQGAATAVAYAARHPEHISQLVLYGGYAAGWRLRDDSEIERIHRAIIDMADLGWGRDNPMFRQLFTQRFIPEGDPEQVSWFNTLCAKTTSPALAAKLLDLRGDVNAVELLPEVAVPTMVLHATGDEVVPLSCGRLLAQKIPGAEFVQLDSRNHILLEDEPAWQRFQEAVLEFTGLGDRIGLDTEVPLFANLTTREREVLALICDGWPNAGISEQLLISEKTVRNHATHIFDKLGVQSRTQAIVRARDGHFRGV